MQKHKLKGKKIVLFNCIKISDIDSVENTADIAVKGDPLEEVVSKCLNLRSEQYTKLRKNYH